MFKTNYFELTLDQFSQWSSSLKTIFFLFLVLIICILNERFIFSEKWSQYKNLINEENKLKKEFENKYKKSAVESYQRQLNLLQKHYSNSLKILVNKNEMTNLLNQVSQAGSSSGIIFDFFTPKDKENKKELIINMKILGDYQKLILFLSKLANFKQLISFNNFEITAENDLSSTNNFPSLEHRILKMNLLAHIHLLPQ